jgi:beta-glucosidase
MGGDDATGLGTVGHSTGTVFGIPHLGVPPVYFTDGPGGVREGIGATQAPATALPAPLALAASFDARLAGRYGALIASEAKHHGDDVLLGPTLNIVRVPRGGRSFESYGEDPYLTGRMAVGFIRGVQGAGVIATAKHYAANNQETGRLTVDVVAGERTLREIYLPHFEAAVRKGHVGAVMSAYNKVNGPFAGASRPLLRDVLMRSFGFRGFVLSDWFAGG